MIAQKALVWNIPLAIAGSNNLKLGNAGFCRSLRGVVALSFLGHIMTDFYDFWRESVGNMDIIYEYHDIMTAIWWVPVQKKKRIL